jgi:hypothetical protein
LTDAAYIPLDEIQTVDLSTCADGLFQSTPSDMFRNVIITTFGDARYIVYLEDPKGALCVPLPAGGTSSRLGILWPKPSIEVDPSTLFNPDRDGETAGDLLVGSQTSIVTREPDGWHNEPQRTPLWAGDANSGKPLGFRSWRLVSVAGDRRRVIFRRSNPAK